MGTKTTETPEATKGERTVLGGTHGKPEIHVQVITIGGYTFYQGTQSGAFYESCGRCGGSGHMNGFEYVLAGVCFECGGNGAVSRKEVDLDALREIVRKRLVAATGRARRAEREAEKARQAAAAWAEANADLAEGLAAILVRRDAIVASDEAWKVDTILDSTLVEFGWKAQRGSLSEAQTSYAASLLAQQAEKDEAAAAEQARKAAAQYLGTVNEKLTVEGAVKRAMTIEVDSHSGYGTERKRLVVLDVEGSDVAVFSTAQWAWDAEQGQTLKLTGTVKKHQERDGAAQTTLGGRIKVG